MAHESNSPALSTHLPPFAALRAFEAAARHESFKEAARELGRTPSSVSHQVKSLEGYLGLKLFARHRDSSSVCLTRKGRAYYHEVGGILEELAMSTKRARGELETGPLFVGATAAFVSRWLLPRLNDFNHCHPEIELQIVPNDAPLRFPDDGTDILIQYGSEPAEGFRVEPFLRTSRFPVCSPKLFDSMEPPKRPEELKDYPLLRDEYGDCWGEWFKETSAPSPPMHYGQKFAHCELTLRAAKEGQGVALAYGALIDAELSSGELVRLFDIETTKKTIYSMTYPESYSNNPRISAFRNWVFNQVAPKND
jgi:LysR family glycine cleavage system transcriptional activator